LFVNHKFSRLPVIALTQAGASGACISVLCRPITMFVDMTWLKDIFSYSHTPSHLLSAKL